MVASLRQQRLVSGGAHDPTLAMKKEKKAMSLLRKFLLPEKNTERDSPFLSGPCCVWRHCWNCSTPLPAAWRGSLDDVVGGLNQRALECVWSQNFQIRKIINSLIAYTAECGVGGSLPLGLLSTEESDFKESLNSECNVLFVWVFKNLLSN